MANAPANFDLTGGEGGFSASWEASEGEISTYRLVLELGILPPIVPSSSVQNDFGWWRKFSGKKGFKQFTFYTKN